MPLIQKARTGSGLAVQIIGGLSLRVVGWRIDERVKVTKETKRVLCLKFKRR